MVELTVKRRKWHKDGWYCIVGLIEEARTNLEMQWEVFNSGEKLIISCHVDNPSTNGVDTPEAKAMQRDNFVDEPHKMPFLFTYWISLFSATTLSTTVLCKATGNVDQRLALPNLPILDHQLAAVSKTEHMYMLLNEWRAAAVVGNVAEVSS
jgi:hypothetical protein